MRLRFLSLAFVLVAAPVAAQQVPPTRALTTADYARAERFLRTQSAPLVLPASVPPTWLAEDRFWYRNTFADGVEFVLVNPARKTRTRAFDHTKLAAALGAAADTAYAPFALPFTTLEFLKHVLEPLFPNTVRHNGRQTDDRVVRVETEAAVEDPLLSGLLEAERDPLWWLEMRFVPDRGPGQGEGQGADPQRRKSGGCRARIR